MANRYCDLPGSEKIKDTYNNINIGFDLVQQDMDSKSPSTHRHPNATGATDGFMSKEDKAKSDAATSAATQNTLMQRDAEGRAKVAAPAAADDIARKAEVDTVQTDLNTHKNDVVVHVTQAEHDKLASIAEGAEVNQNAFSKINNIEAGTQSDELTIKGSTGISVTTNPATKEVTITATGDATPGPHAETHLTGGSDPIPVATDTADGLMPSSAVQVINTVITKQGEWDGKETPAGAQTKADAAEQNANTYTDGYAAPKVHEHAASAITSGTLATARLPAATTSAAGIVQLNNTATSTSTTQAATAAAVKTAMDRANAAFQSASDGKNQIATAITGKGVPASGSDTFTQLATKIDQIVVGKQYAKASITFSSTTIDRTGATLPLPALGFVPTIAIIPNMEVRAEGTSGSGYAAGTVTLSTLTYMSGEIIGRDNIEFYLSLPAGTNTIKLQSGIKAIVLGKTTFDVHFFS